MINSTLQYLEPLFDALEANIEAGDEATVAEQAAEVVCVVRHLIELLKPCDMSVARANYDALTASIDELTQVRDALLADVQHHIDDGEDVTGFKIKAGAITRKIPDVDAALVALEGLVPSDQLFEKKFLGVPAIEKLLKATGLKPEEREAVLELFVVATPGKPKLEAI